jgi:hypothetical protein
MEEVTTFLAMSGKPIQINGWFFNRDYWKKPLTLTLCAAEGGTLTADAVTGFPGDTVELSTAYNTYYRFSGYDVTGGTVDGNTFTFGDEDATVYAAFKPNAFTATGTYNWTNLTVYSTTNTAARIKRQQVNGILKSFTGSKPANWPDINAAWNVSDASAYKFNANVTVRTRYVNSTAGSKYPFRACKLFNASKQSQFVSSTAKIPNNTNSDMTCNCSNVATQGPISLSACLSATWGANTNSVYVQMSLPTNAWTATGYAP